MRQFSLFLLLVVGISCSKKLAPAEVETIEIIADTMVITAPEPDSMKVEQLIPPDTVVYYKKTPCYGSCQAFEVTIYDNGNVFFDGQRNCSLDGLHKCQLTSDALSYVDQMLRSYEIFALARRYPDNTEYWIPDLQSSLLIAKQDEARKVIDRNHSAPDSYLKFEDELYHLVVNQNYAPAE